MFGRRTSSPDETTASEQDERIMSSPAGGRGRNRRNSEARQPMAQTNQVGTDGTATALADPATERRDAAPARWGAADRADADRTETMPATDPLATQADADAVAEHEAIAKRRWAHVSSAATLCLIVGTLSVAATLTGLLAPIGFAAGVLAVLLGIVALYAVRKPGVTGHALVGLGVLFGVVAIVLSVIAMTDSVSWLSSKTNEITNVHNWLNNHIHWLRRW
jgi:hypothetical protein